MLGAKTETTLRIDNDIAKGISRTAKERDADLIIMGWNKTTYFPSRLFSNIIDNVIWSAHCPVAVIYLLKQPTEIRSILVPVGNASLQSLHKMQFAQLLAEFNQAKVTVLHVCAAGTSMRQIIHIKNDLEVFLSEMPQLSVKVIRCNDIVQGILSKAYSTDVHPTDLIILSFTRCRSSGGLMANDITHRLLQELNCSVILFNDSFP